MTRYARNALTFYQKLGFRETRRHVEDGAPVAVQIAFNAAWNSSSTAMRGVPVTVDSSFHWRKRSQPRGGEADRWGYRRARRIVGNDRQSPPGRGETSCSSTTTSWRRGRAPELPHSISISSTSERQLTSGGMLDGEASRHGGELGRTSEAI